jgi:PAS domain S-box-containing protein
MADPSGDASQKLVDSALALCRAESAGVSVLSAQDGGSFRWQTFSGCARVTFTESPVGEFDWRIPLLLSNPDGAFPFLADVSEPISEALVVPIESGGQAVGSLWAILHDPSRHFESEDLRLLTSLGRFASAYHSTSTADFAADAEARFRDMIDALPAAIYSTDAEGVVTHFNPAAVEFSGRVPKIGVDRWCVSSRLYRPDGSHLPLSECPMAILLKEGRTVRGVEVILERPDGRRMWVMPHPTPLRDRRGRMTGAVNMLVDITERKDAEEAQARLAAIVDSSDDAIVGKTLDGIITSWNRGARDIFGYTEEEVKGKHISIIIPEDRLAEEDEVLARLRRGEKIDHFETERRTKDGRIVQISLTVSPIQDSKGRIIGASKVARDITERKRAEDELRQSQKLESIGILAGGIAHDFNNLLTGILGNASLALEMLEPNDPVRDLLDDLVRASESAAHLTQQMLAYAGKGQFFLQPVDLSELVSDINSFVQGAIPRSVQLILDLAPELPRVEADRSQLQQLVMNLVINGAEAIGEHKTGTVWVTTAPLIVDEEFVRTFADAQIAPGCYISLQVQDTGCGMDEETKARIFDPFFTTKFMGRGLGLAAALGIIRGHKGAIRVSSTPGMGSTFQVFLPAMDRTGAYNTMARKTESECKGTILVVDDEAIVRRTATTALQRSGFRVITAENGRDAVELFRTCSDQVSAILLDLTMPLMSAEETLEHLHAIRPDVPVVLTSGYNQQDALRRFDSKNLAGFLQKPFAAGELVKRIQAALEI